MKKKLIKKNIRWMIMVPLSCMALLSSHLHAQLITEMDDESKFYAQSKQVNQFFRRFNGEEDEKGNRYYEGDKHYRSDKLRKKYFSILFDEDNKDLTHSKKKEFIENILEDPQKSILDFHGGDWFAEVQAIFISNTKPQQVTLYLNLEKDHLGYKWVISHVHSDQLEKYFPRDTNNVKRFLHPMSHELDFMNLRKAFNNKDSINQFSSKSFKPDHLSILLYETAKGNITFKSVEDVKFHFFQIKGWYFELKNFNRPGYNTGWLISNLVKLKSDSEKKLLLNYLYDEVN